MSTKREYENRHWKWIVRANFNQRKMSRKTKKALSRHYDEIVKDYEQTDDFMLSELPECISCYGSGQDDPYDIGWGFTENCLDCDGTGKTGWKYDESGKKQPMKQFLKKKVKKTARNKAFLDLKS